MASGIPNTTGVRVNDSGSPTSAGDPAAATRSVHTVEAGDQSVGHISGFSLGQTSSLAVRNRVASPDDTLIGRTVAHSSSASCSGDSLNASARASSMFTFSDDVATTMCVHPSSAKSPLPPSPPPSDDAPKQPVSTSIEAVSSAAATAALRVRIRALGEAKGRVVARSGDGPGAMPTA